MPTFRKLMPLMWLGVVSADRRRFDAITAPRLPAPLLVRPPEVYVDPEKVGRVSELVLREGGLVLAVCEFDRLVDPSWALSFSGLPVADARYEPECPRTGTYTEAEYQAWADKAVLVIPVVTPAGAYLLPRDQFIWPEQLAEFEGEQQAASDLARSERVLGSLSEGRMTLGEYRWLQEHPEEATPHDVRRMREAVRLPEGGDGS